MRSSGINAYSNNLPAQNRSGTAGATSNINQAGAVQSRLDQAPEQAVNTRFSPRAARLARLNHEFDLSAADFHISQSFLQRMVQLDLMRKDESEVLISRLPHPPEGEPRTATLFEMEDFLANLADYLDAGSTQSHLSQVLRDTRTILEHMAISAVRSHDAEIGTTLAAIGLHFSSDNAPVLSNQQAILLEDVRTAMVVAYKLNPLNHNLEQLNAYARVSGNLV
ncbi:MAG: hypothetical protein OIF57_18035 [Marinobacterium sp.]|nr:hypothetical protein [Marinobacterium sp.]